MKKMILVMALVIGFAGMTSAQVDGKAIGLRLGYGGEITYQHPLGSANRLELDLGFNTWGGTVWGTNLSGLYQWVWDLSDLGDGFNWYAGVGGAVGLGGGNFGMGILGQVGIEYHFKVPLMLSVDYRPGLFVVPNLRSAYDGLCLSLRYKF